MILDPGAHVGPYRIAQRLGRGATGVVYHASHPTYGTVALKIMAADLAEEEDARARFVREAHTLVRLRHRNIVTVFEGGVHDDLPYIAMELLGGATLAARLSTAEPLSLERKLDIVIQLCEGLQFAHERGVIHRDVKPANVWILGNGGVKLLDFGTARVLGSTFTRRRDLVGSAAYMAPEQLVGSDVDGRADVFAAGAILYELLTGRRLFEGESIGAVMNKILHGRMPALTVPGIPPDILRALDGALQKDPARRYQEAAEFGSDLMLARYGLGEEPLTPRPEAAPARVPDLAAPDAPTVIIPRTPVPASGTSTREDVLVRDEAARFERADTGSEAAAPRHPQAPAASRVLVPVRDGGKEVLPQTVRWAHAARTSGLHGIRQALAGAVGLSRIVPAWTVLHWRAIAIVALAVAAVTAGFARWMAVPAVYRFDIRSVPAGATIEIDGTPTGFETPAILSLPTRPDRLRLLASGYAPLEAAIANEPASDPILLAYTLRRIVRVESQPGGARILVDGMDSGLSTPADVAIAAGSLPVLVLQSEERLPATVQLTESLLDRGLVSVALAPVRGRTPDVQRAGHVSQPAAADRPAAEAEVTGTEAPAPIPTASVEVHVAGLYPFEISGCEQSSAAAVRHDFRVQAPCTLRLRAPKYHLDQTSRVVARGGRIELTVPPLARVQLRSKHESCTLVLNGQAVGSPPVDLEVAAGTYNVVIQCSDRTYSIRALTIEPGQSSRRLDDFLQ